METLNGLLHAGLWNKLFRRGFLVKKEIRFPEHGYYEDMFVFISSLMNTNKIAFSSTATYHYRVNPTSQTFSHDLNKRLSSYDEMIENFELLEKKYHLSQDQEILNALYREINANRQNLFISFRKDAKKLSEHFKKHPIPLVLRDTSPLWGGYSISLANTELAGHTSSMASEEKFPELSIIIPVYNVEKYLRQCLDSILTQTSQNYEVILVDDGSTDESPAICDQYAKKDKRFKVIHKKNEGVSVARNAGIDICTGEFISFVDSDDWLEPTYVSTLICQMRNADLIFFSHIVHSEDGLKSSYQLKEKFIDNENAKEDFILHLFNNMLYVDFYGYTWNKAFRRDIIMKNNIRFVSGLTFYEDEIFTNDYIMHVKKVRSISTPLYNYNWKVGGLSFSKKKSWQYFKLAEKTNEFAQSLETENAILFFKKRAENMLLMGLSDSDMSLGQWYKAFKKLKDQNGQQFSTRHIARIIYKRFVGSRSKDA